MIYCQKVQILTNALFSFNYDFIEWKEISLYLIATFLNISNNIFNNNNLVPKNLYLHFRKQK